MKKTIVFSSKLVINIVGFVLFFINLTIGNKERDTSINIMEKIIYKIDIIPDVEQIIELYESSGIIRPTTDKERITRMYANSNVIITAWSKEKLVGVARALSDFAICCYLSDLAVRKEYQSKGIGTQLIEKVKKVVGKTEEISLLLLSAPNAINFYTKMDFEKIENGFIIKRKI